MITSGLQKLLEYPVAGKKSFILYKEIIKDNINIKYHYKKYCTILTRAIIEDKKILFQQLDNNIFQ
jgi:hypothetical protein